MTLWSLRKHFHSPLRKHSTYIATVNSRGYTIQSSDEWNEVGMGDKLTLKSIVACIRRSALIPYQWKFHSLAIQEMKIWNSNNTAHGLLIFLKSIQIQIQKQLTTMMEKRIRKWTENRPLKPREWRFKIRLDMRRARLSIKIVLCLAKDKFVSWMFKFVCWLCHVAT